MIKKFLVVALVGCMAMLSSLNASAQILDGVRYGVHAGLTTSSLDAKGDNYKTTFSPTVGFTVQIPVALGFAIQPSLVYSAKGYIMESKALKDIPEDYVNGISKSKFNLGYLELPVQIQWGPDLVLFRPYVFVEPYIGYALYKSGSYTFSGKVKNNELKINPDNLNASIKQDMKKTMHDLEGGIAVGMGVEFWKMQISAKYYHNLGPLFKAKELSASTVFGDFVYTQKREGSLHGLTFSVGILF